MAYSDFDLEFSTRLQSDPNTAGSDMASPPTGVAVQNSSLSNPLTGTGEHCRAIQHNAVNNSEASVGQVKMLLANTGGVSAQAFYDIGNDQLVSMKMRMRLDRVSGNPDAADSADNALNMVGLTAFSSADGTVYSGGYELVLQAKGSGASRAVEVALRASQPSDFSTGVAGLFAANTTICSGSYALDTWYYLRLDVVPESPYQKKLIAYSSADDGASWTEIGQMTVRDDASEWSAASPNRSGIISLRCGEASATELYDQYIDGFDSKLTPQDLVNQEPTGTLDVSGTPVPGETLTLVNNFNEPDGIAGDVSYRWEGFYPVEEDVFYLEGNPPAGDFQEIATGETLVIQKRNPESSFPRYTTIRAFANYRDSLGYPSEVASGLIQQQGSTISFSGDTNGQAAAGATLTADVSQFENSFVNGIFAYQWSLDGSPLAGETTPVLVVPNTGIDGQNISFLAQRKNPINPDEVTNFSDNVVATYKDSLTTDLLLSGNAIGKNGDYSEALTLSVVDPDVNDSFTFSLVAGAGDQNNSDFVITGGDRLSVDWNGTGFFPPDWPSADPFYVRIRATNDATGTYIEKSFVIDNTEIEDTVAPTITGSASHTVGENNTAVGSYSADETVTWSLSGADQALFSISEQGALSFNSAPDFEAPADADGNNVYQVTVIATDAANNSSELAVSVSIFNLDEEAPVIGGGEASISVSLVEGNTAVASFTANEAVVWSFGGGADDSLFDITGTSLNDADLTFKSAPTFGSPADADSNNVYQVIVVSTDGSGNTSQQAVSITVTEQVAEDTTAPTITSGAVAASIAENSGANQVVYTATADEAVTWSLKEVDDHADFSLSVNEVRLTADPDFETKSSYSFTVIATDAAGNFSEQAVSLSITDADEVAPTITSGAVAASIAENSGANQVIYTATADEAVTWSLKAVDDHAAFNLSVNEVSLIADPDFETKASYSFTVIATDAAGNSSEQAVSLSITDADEIAPVAPSVSLANDTSGGSLVTSDATLALADVEAGAAVEYSSDAVSWSAVEPSFVEGSNTVYVRQTDAAGNVSDASAALIFVLDNTAPSFSSSSTASVDENSGANQVVYTAVATDANSITYSLAEVGDHAAFSLSGNEVSLIADPDFEDKASYSFSLVATDAAGNASAPFAVTLSVNNVNEAPVGNVSISGLALEGETLTADTSGVSDPDNTGAISFSYAWLRNGAAIGATASTYVVQPADVGQSITVQVSYTDEGGTVETLTSGALVIAAGMIISSDATGSVTEGQPAGQTAYTITVANAPANGTLVYSISGADAGAFLVDSSTGVVTIQDNPDFENKDSYAITVEAAKDGQTASKAITVSVTDVNEPPVVSLINAVASLSEGTYAVSTKIADISITDDALGTNALSLAGADAASFSIVNDSELHLNAATLDFEAKNTYSVDVVVSDGDFSDTASLTLSITNVNEAPTSITLDGGLSVSFAENQPTGTEVGTLASTDPDAGDTVTFSLVAGIGDNDNGSFEIVNGNKLASSASFDAEANNALSVRVRATDAGGLSVEQAFTINITNVNEAPTAIALSATSFNENIDAGSVVATLSGTDPDLGDSLTFSLQAGTGDTDNGSFTIEGNSLKINASPDFEAKSSYSIRVRATDAGGLSFEESFTLNVNDLDDTAPVITGDAAVSVVENTTAVATYSSEAGVTWSLAGADKDLFSLVDGVLSFQAAPDFETPLDADTNNVYSVVVEATDAAGNKGTLSVDVTVTDADEVAPNITSGAVATSIVENSGANQVVYTATADEAVTWSLKEVDDHAAFSLSGNEVRLIADPDFETKASYSFTVIATDAANNSSEQAVSLSITDADEIVPVLLSAVPTDGATNVAVDANVVLTFDEAPSTRRFSQARATFT